MSKPTLMTFAEAANEWLLSASLEVKPSTYASYTASLNLHILPAIGRYQIQHLSAADISCFARQKLTCGRVDGKGGLSAKTVRDLLSIIKAIMHYAHGANLVTSVFTIPCLPQSPREMRVLSRREQTLLETVLTTDPDIHKLGVMLCLYTGIRIGEACALRWQHFSADFEMLSIRQTLRRMQNLDDGSKTVLHIDTPKSRRSVREIPVPKFLTPHLRRFARDGRTYFLSTANMPVTEPRTLQNHFTRYVKAARITGANFHTTRHTFATRCIEAGVDIKSISEMLGHASVNITLNRYVHSSFEQKRAGMNKLEQYAAIFAKDNT